MHTRPIGADSVGAMCSRVRGIGPGVGRAVGTGCHRPVAGVATRSSGTPGMGRVLVRWQASGVVGRPGGRARGGPRALVGGRGRRIRCGGHRAPSIRAARGSPGPAVVPMLTLVAHEGWQSYGAAMNKALIGARGNGASESPWKSGRVLCHDSAARRTGCDPTCHGATGIAGKTRQHETWRVQGCVSPHRAVTVLISLFHYPARWSTPRPVARVDRVKPSLPSATEPVPALAVRACAGSALRISASRFVRPMARPPKTTANSC